MKKALILISMAAIAGAANAQILYTGGTYSENFDGMGTTTVPNFTSATIGAQVAIPGVTGFSGTKIAGTGTAAVSLLADDGTSNQGAIRNLANVGSAERALGSTASASNIMGFGFELKNTSSSALSSVTINFTREAWRSSTTTQNIYLGAYGVSGGSINSSNYLTDLTMTATSALNLVGEPAVGANGALNGNDPLHQAAMSYTFTFSTPLAVNDSLFVRWQDTNDAGNDAILAIDDMTITSTAVPEPATLAVLGLGAAALIRRRRKN